MSRSTRVRHALPLAVLILFTALDLAAGRGQQALALTVISPLVAATVLGRRATAGYAALALVVAALLGVYDQQYTAEALPTQLVRLFGVALGGAIAVAACGEVQHGEEEQHRQRQCMPHPGGPAHARTPGSAGFRPAV